MRNSLYVSVVLAFTLACDRDREPTAIPAEVIPLNEIVGSVAGFTTLTTNLDHTCILDASGRAFCAGGGIRGAIGYGGSALFITDPYPVTGGYTFTSITAGSLHTCALTSPGQAYCWGSNEMGELGSVTPKQCDYGFVACALVPVPVSTNLRFTLIDAGNRFTCALDAMGRAYCWGDNTFGQLGDGSTLSRATPAPVAGALSFVALRSGGFHACGLTAAGDLYCWGDNKQGQLGAASANQCMYFQPYPCSLTPIRVATLKFLTMDAGSLHTCAVDPNRKAYCWGSNSLGQLGDAGLLDQPRPTPVVGPQLFTRIATGAYSTCGVDAADVGYCWGQSFGRSPALIGGGIKWRVLLPHDDHRCGLALDGSPYCWGLEQYGELGNGGHHQEQFLTPHLMAPPHTTDLTPVAKIIVTGCVNLACTFNGSYSTDDFGVVGWNWDFGDGTTGTGAIANHTFPQSGTYTVKLTVFDRLQQSNSTSTAVQVYYQPPVNQPPTASFTVTCVVRPTGSGADCKADGTASSDADGSLVSYSWAATGRMSLTGPIVSYPYRVGATPTITLTVKDNAGATGSISKTFTVSGPASNQPPLADFTYQCVPRTPNVGSDCTFDSSPSRDVDGTIVSRTWTASGRSTRTGVTATYPYPRGATPTVTLTVADNLGATGTKTVTLTIP